MVGYRGAWLVMEVAWFVIGVMVGYRGGVVIGGMVSYCGAWLVIGDIVSYSIAWLVIGVAWLVIGEHSWL